MKRAIMKILMGAILVLTVSVNVRAAESETVSVVGGTVNITRENDETTGESVIMVEKSPDVSGDVDLSSLEEKGGKVIIGESAFAGNSEITSMILPDNTESIGVCAFERCRKMTQINIPDSCREIGTYALHNIGVSELTFPEKLKNLGYMCLYGNTKLVKCVFRNSELDLSESGLDYISFDITERLVFWCEDGLTENCPSAYAKRNAIRRVRLNGDEIVNPNQKEITVGNGTITVEYGKQTGTEIETLTVIDSEGLQGVVDLTSLEPEAKNILIGSKAFMLNKKITEVNLPDNTVEIGSYAFNLCSRLKECSIPSGVKVIGEEAFYSTSITSVTIPAACTKVGGRAYESTDLQTVSFLDGNEELTIGERAFYACSKLMSVRLPKQLISMENSVFSNCSSLENICIPDACVTMGDGIFTGATSLKTVKLPALLKRIEDAFFADCPVLKEAAIPKDCEYIGDYAFRNCSELSGISISKDCEYIGDYAFYGCNKISVITIPEPCWTVGWKAFADCDNLQTVYFENPNTQVDEDAFEGVSENLVIYALMSEESDSPYQFCQDNSVEWRQILQNINIVKLPEKLECVYGEWVDTDGVELQGTFYTESESKTWDITDSDWNIEGLDPYTLGEQKTYITYGGVRAESDITICVYYDMDDVRFELNEPAYSGKKQEVEPKVYWIDEEEIEHVLTEDEDYKIISYDNNVNASTETQKAIMNIEGLGNYKGQIQVPFMIKPADISSCEVSGIKGALTVTIRDLTGETENMITLTPGEDYEISYEECDTDETDKVDQVKVVIKGKNNYQGEKTIYVDKDIPAGDKIELPVGQGTITISKTWNADKTVGTITVEESNNVSDDVDLSFLDQMANKTIIGNDVFKDNETITSVQLPENTILIGASAFRMCTELATVNIPDNCETIGDSALLATDLREIEFPEKLTTLGRGSMSWNDNLVKCVFYNSELDVSESGLDYDSTYRPEPLVFWCDDGVSENCPAAFAKRNSIKRVMLDGSEALADNQKKFDLTIGTITVEYGTVTEEGENTITVIESDGVRGVVDLSFLESQATYTVIGAKVFQSNANITSVILPKNTIEIGKYAFCGCSSVTECEIPNGVTSIGEWAFKGVNIASVTFPASLVQLGNAAFESSYVQEVTFEEGEQELQLGYDVFAFCYKLSSVKLPERLTSMGSRVFGYCYALTNIRIPDRCTTIGMGTFIDDRNLTSVKLPDTLKTMETSFFAGCSNLVAVTIPKACESIGSGCFSNCNMLTAITVPKSCEKIESRAFRKCSRLQTVIFENADTKVDPTAFNETNEEYVIYSAKSSLSNSPYQFYLDNKSDVRWDNILQDIVVKKPIEKTEYVYGEAFDYASILIMGVYKTEKGNEQRAIPSTEWTMTGFDSHILGQQTLHFVSQEVQDSSNVKVRVYYDMSQVQVKVQDCSYTGKAYEPKPELYWLDTAEIKHILEEGKDYTISSYENNENASTESKKAAIHIVGSGNYEGTISPTFTIEPADISPCEVTGTEDVPVVTIIDLTGETDKKVTLELNKDYEILPIEDDADVDTGDMAEDSKDKVKVCIKGINNYQGEKIAYLGKKRTTAEKESEEPTMTDEDTSKETTSVSTTERMAEKTTEAGQAEYPTEKSTEVATTGDTETEKKVTKKSDKSTSKKGILSKGDTFTVSKMVYRITGKTTVTFVKCKDNTVKSLKIPNTVKKEGKTYKVTKVAKEACYQYAQLKDVSIGNNVTVIADRAFASCQKLRSVTIGTGLERIGGKVFDSDKKLKKIKFKSEVIKEIDKDTFKGVYKKVKIIVPKTKVRKYNQLING